MENARIYVQRKHKQEEEASTNCSDLNNESLNNQILHLKGARLENITDLINNILEIRNDFKNKGLTFYKDVSIKGYLLTVYKVFKEPDEELKHIYYYSFNGCYAIEWKQIIRTRERATDIERDLKQTYNINVY